MRKLTAAGLLVALACAAAFANGDKKPFLPAEKGSFWEYDLKYGEDKKTGKIGVSSVEANGTLNLTLDGFQSLDDDMKWKLKKDSIVWMYKGGGWTVLKTDAKKGDSWTSNLGGEEMTLRSVLVDIEDANTPAGKFKGCLRVMNNTPEGLETVCMWWAKGIGIVKVEVSTRGKVQESWLLKSYSVGPEVGDDELKQLLEKADVVAVVAVPKEGAGSRKVQVKVSGLFKGQPSEEDGEIMISLPVGETQLKPFEPGEFVVFLKKEGAALVMLHSVLYAEEKLLDRLTELVTPEEESLENLENLCREAQIIAGVEIVVLEDRGSFQYYVAKVISIAKGTGGRKHIDVLSTPGVVLEKGKAYILFLNEAVESGRRLTRLVDSVKGVIEYDEGLLNKLAEMSKEE